MQYEVAFVNYCTLNELNASYSHTIIVEGLDVEGILHVLAQAHERPTD